MKGQRHQLLADNLILAIKDLLIALEPNWADRVVEGELNLTVSAEDVDRVLYLLRQLEE